MGAKRILAVENNDLVLSFLEAGLVTAGYDVDTASNGREALEKIDRRAYDLIISDVNMPELDGLALCRALGERRAHDLRRLLLLTGPDAISDHQTFLAESGVRAVAKPVALDDLHVIVEGMIREPATVSAGASGPVSKMCRQCAGRGQGALPAGHADSQP